MRKIFNTYILSLSMLFLAACSAGTKIPVTVTGSPMPSNTVEIATVTIQATETATQTPESTHTSTLVPTTTPTASPVPSMTPLATLEPDAAQLEIARLMETNDGCHGACFWGIIPGVTDFEQAVRFLNTLKGKGIRDEDGVQYYNNSFTNGDAPIYTTFILRQSNGIVKELGFTVVRLHDPNVTNEDWFAFRPDVFLKTNGVPKQVNIIMSEGPEGRLSYAMGFFYDQMVIWYNGNQVVIKPQTILQACPLENHNIDRFDLTLGQYAEDVSIHGVDLTQMTSLTLDEFYELMTSDEEMACFDLDTQKYLSP